MLNRLLLNLASSDLISPRARSLIYRHLGLEIPHNLQIGSLCYFTHDDLSTLRLGQNVFINLGVYFDNGAEIRIGNNVDIAPNVRFLTATHLISHHDKRAGWGCIRKPISIGNGCWICDSVLILPGAVIGDGCVIGAGAVVPENAVLEPNSCYCGVPAKKKRSLESPLPIPTT